MASGASIGPLNTYTETEAGNQRGGSTYETGPASTGGENAAGKKPDNREGMQKGGETKELVTVTSGSETLADEPRSLAAEKARLQGEGGGQSNKHGDQKNRRGSFRRSYERPPNGKVTVDNFLLSVAKTAKPIVPDQEYKHGHQGGVGVFNVTCDPGSSLGSSLLGIEKEGTYGPKGGLVALDQAK